MYMRANDKAKELTLKSQHQGQGQKMKAETKVKDLGGKCHRRQGHVLRDSKSEYDSIHGHVTVISM